MRLASRLGSKLAACWMVLGLLAGLAPAGTSAQQVATDAAVRRPSEAVSACTKPVYLTFDTGHMGVANLVADILKRQNVRVTFFMANERTLNGGGSLDDSWAIWWRDRYAEGHAFGSHTYDHVYWVADLPAGRFRVRPTFGPHANQPQVWTAGQYCAELDRVGARFTEMTGGQMSRIFRAAGGKTSSSLIDAAKQCGFQHVGWSNAGFLGDELSSEKFPNQQLLNTALSNIRRDDILMAHLGIWSRKDPWAPAVLEPLIVGLKQKGFCFRTLDEHPIYGKRKTSASTH